jgi:hypothetical protein
MLINKKEIQIGNSDYIDIRRIEVAGEGAFILQKFSSEGKSHWQIRLIEEHALLLAKAITEWGA